MTASFYRAFEDRYRGSRELIRQRLEVYRPFIEPLQQIHHPATALDLGCGRGEWLELLRDNGFEYQGVDLDEGILGACRERGLRVVQGEAIAYLGALEDESQSVISAFHVAEHISFDDLRTLVIESLRVLKPGGLLILETPNPENLIVGASSFFLDPTHLRPIPPLLLSFLPEHYGFFRVHTVRLQERPELHGGGDVSLMDVLDGVSPDYAIVAQKNGPQEVLEKFEIPFSVHYGIQLQELAARYDEKLERQVSAFEQRLKNTESQAGGMTDALAQIAALQDQLVETATQLASRQAAFDHLQSEAISTAERLEVAVNAAHVAASQAQESQQRADLAEAQAQESQQRADLAEAQAQEFEQHLASSKSQCRQHVVRIGELDANLYHWWQLAGTLEAERNALRRSWSWRITWPMRFGVGLLVHPVRTLRGTANQVIYHSINILQWPLAGLMVAVLKRPQSSARVNQWLLKRYPALHNHLREVARRRGLVPENAALKWSSRNAEEVSDKSAAHANKQITGRFYLKTDQIGDERMDAELALDAIRAELKIFRGEE